MRGTVLFVANFPANTGYAWDFIEGLFAGMATRLAQTGVRTFIAYPAMAAPPRALQGTPATPITLDARLDTVASLRQTIAFARRERVDLLYLIDRPARSPFYPVLRAAGVRTILVHDHTSGAGTVPRGLKRLAKGALARVPGFTADRVIAVSDFVAGRQRTVGMVPAERVTRVWNSVMIPPHADHSRTRNARRALGLDAQVPVIACTARATPEKGVHHLFRAFDRLAATSDALLLYAGDGPAFASLQALRDSLPSRDRIRLYGYRPDRELLLEAADVCVVPSVWDEAFGLAALEAMARAKPVVATAVGGIPEVIEAGVTGLLVPPGDEAQLCAAIAALLGDRAAGARIGSYARDDVATRFTAETQLIRLTELVTGHLAPRDARMIGSAERLACQR